MGRSVQEYRKFMVDNHIQGYAHAESRYGLVYKNELVMVASFSSNRKIFESLDDGWFELVRLGSVLNTSVVGGFSKLLKHFIKAENPKGIKTYCDRRLFNGRGYEAVGFTHVYDTKPNFSYAKTQKRFSRFNFQRHRLPDFLDKYDPKLSTKDNIEANGFHTIHDCGNSVYELLIK